jgi:hypothetical protein
MLSGSFAPATDVSLDLTNHEQLIFASAHVLTQRLLPLLVKARGQIVFVNSRAVLAVNRPIDRAVCSDEACLECHRGQPTGRGQSEGRERSLGLSGTHGDRNAGNLFKNEAEPYHAEKLLQPEDVETWCSLDSHFRLPPRLPTSPFAQ